MNNVSTKSQQLLENKLKPIGVCYWCGVPVSFGKIFCCSECRSDFELNNRSEESYA